MPFLSVIIPAHNKEGFIEKCLKAVRASDYKDYELIFVDDASRDRTLELAKKYADKIIEQHKNMGRNYSRLSGVNAAQGEIIVNIDSDVLIKPDTLSKIVKYLIEHPQVSAVTGLLSREHPNMNFFSQYKNLYMYYIFKKLPERISFLYGSIYAIRHKDYPTHITDTQFTDDTELGLKLFTHGKKITFLKDLEVMHLKSYNLFSFIKNDFTIPCEWAKTFFHYKGYRQIGRRGTGYLHSPKEQLLSLILSCLIAIFCFTELFFHFSLFPVLPLVLIWFLANQRFFSFLNMERGCLFMLLAILTTFLDNIVMVLGILCGFIKGFFKNTEHCKDLNV